MHRQGTAIVVALAGVMLAGVSPAIGQQATRADHHTATATQVFKALADGGSIELQNGGNDDAGVAHMRQHLQELALAFATSELSSPALVHLQCVPGGAVMAAKRDAITYVYSELPRGGELRFVTKDPEAVQAIHAFVAFQGEHHSGAAHGHHGGGDHRGAHQSGTHSATHQSGAQHSGVQHNGMAHNGMAQGCGTRHGGK